MTSTVASPRHHRTTTGAMLGGMLNRLGRQTLYLLTGFPLALAAFVTSVATLAIGLGLLITIVGFAVLTVSVLLARVFATIERARLVAWMDATPAPVRYRSSNPDDTLVRRVATPLTDPQSWRDVANAIFGFPVALATWVVAVVWLAVAGSGLTYPLWAWAVPRDEDNEDLPELLGLGSDYGTRVAFWMLCGAIAAATLPLVMAWSSRLAASVGEALLLAPARRDREIDALVEGRDATRAAEQSSFRRLERDIHDGPQQRLVRLSMDLGRAKRRAEEDAPELAEAIDNARRQAHDALDELRALSRGIAPPILADRGLERALEELAVRSTIPTETIIELRDLELDDHIEAAVYFVASEALANAAKHGAASRADLRVSVEGSTLTVVVSDDGVGGARTIPGHGLAGLVDRAKAAGGTLTVTSPAGGPTVIAAELPCGS